MTGSTPLYGIRFPDRQTKLLKLGEELESSFGDVERVLAAAGVPPVTPAPVMVAASAAAREQFWGTPGTEAARRTLQGRGATTIRTDRGWTERYFATYDAGTNPGGAPVPGWYPVDGALPRARYQRTSNLTIQTGSTLIPMTSLASGRAVGFTPQANGSVRIDQPGVWEFLATLTFSSAASGWGNFEAFVNGTARPGSGHAFGQTSQESLHIAFTDQLATNDVIEFRARPATAIDVVSVDNSSARTYLSLRYVQPF